MHRYLLEITVFLSGCIVLTYEVIGARILAPYYGTSTYVWTAMIGVILASLSLGYYIGGKLADKKHAKIEFLSTLILLSAIAIMITYVLRTPVLDFLSSIITDTRIGSVVAALLLFLPASILLGMTSPYAVKLKIEKLEKTGATIGTMSALGTLGSILGTFLAGFILIPYFGISTILATLPILLIFLSLALAPHHFFWQKTIALIAMILATLSVDRTLAE